LRLQTNDDKKQTHDANNSDSPTKDSTGWAKNGPP